MKKIFTLFVAVMASVGTMNAGIVSGTCGNNLTWTVNSKDSTLIIEGSGAMTNFSSGKAPWYEYKAYIAYISLPDGLTNIGNHAFDAHSNLKSIVIPNSVTEIGAYAFDICKKLSSITFSENLKTIGERAFRQNICTSIVLPESLTYMGNGNFDGCKNITSIKIPDNLATIEDQTFASCTSLTEVTIGRSVTSIGSSAFNNTPINTVVCYAINPPSGGANCNINEKKCILYVPYSSIEIYKNSIWWEDFAEILPISETESSCPYGIIGDTTAYYCSGTSFEWHGVNYTTADMPITHAYKSKVYPECDSIVTLHLVELPMFWGDTVASICHGASFMWHGVEYTIGDYNHTYTSKLAGCDSIVTLHLIEWPGLFEDTTAYYCFGTSFEWHGVHYTTADPPPTHTYTSKVTGCDSIVTLHLIEWPELKDDTTAYYCHGTSFEWHGTNYTAADMHITHPYKSKVYPECDSIVFLKLIELPAIIGDTTAYYCFGTSFEWHGVNYTTADPTPTHTYTSKVTGCDSIVTLHLIEWPELKDDTTAYYCHGTSFNWYGVDYTTATLPAPTHILKSKVYPDCDSIVTLHLIEWPELKDDTTAHYCFGTSFEWHGVNYTTADPTPTHTYTSKVTGCDSIVTLHLIEWPELVGDTTAIIIKGSSFNWHGIEYTAANTPATHTYAAKVYPYCDSIVTLHLVEIDPPCEPASGTCGDNLTWELSCEGVLSINGTGEMTNSPWYSYNQSIKSVIIEDGTTSIGYGAFDGCSSLSSIELPEGVSTIGGCAFRGCSSLKSIEFPSSLMRIYEDGFFNCSSLSSITCEATTPPTLSNEKSGVFYGVDKSIPLYVPGQSINLYKSADQWKDFFNILPIPGTEVPVYLVIFLDYNSNVLSEQSVAEGSAVEAPNVPEREGYIFKGWNVDISHITARTFAIALYDKVGVEVTYKAEDGDVLFSEHADLHIPEAPSISGKTFAGWLTENIDRNGIVLRATYTVDNPTTNDDVTVVPGSNSANVTFPFVTGAITYVLVIRDLFGRVVCKIMFNASGRLLGIAFAPSRERSEHSAQSDSFQFTVEGLDPSTTYEYEFVAHDETDEVIETLAGSFTTSAEVPTDFENVQSSEINVQKVIANDQVLILRGDHTYTLTGQEVK